MTEFTTLPLEIEIPSNIRDFNLGLMFRESLDFNKGMFFVFDEVAEQSFHMRETKIPLDIAFIREDGIIESIKELEPFDENPVASDGEVLCALEVNRGWFAENNVEVGDQIDIEEGKKDACYHEVKSHYSVWPSAYASGALVKCRKEEVETVSEEDYDRVKDRRLERGGVDGNDDYRRAPKNTNNEFGKKKPKSGGMSVLDFVRAEIRKKHGDKAIIDTKKKEEVSEAVRLPAKTGNLVDTYFMYRGRYFALKMFFPQTTMPRRSDVVAQIEKVYPGARLATFRVSTYEPGQPVLHAEESSGDGESIKETLAIDSRTSAEVAEKTKVTEGAAWTKKSGLKAPSKMNEAPYQVGDIIDNSAAVKRQQQRRAKTLDRILKGDPKKWDFSRQNVNRRMVTGESKEENLISEKPGDGYLGPTPIPNPIRMAKDAVDSTNRKSAEKVRKINTQLPGSASMPKYNEFNKDTSPAYKRYFGGGK